MRNTILPFIVCSILLGYCTFTNAQEPAITLSKNGAAHWRAAQVLLDMASSTDDYQQVIIEFEKVTESDPGYAPVYMKLGHLYAQLGNTKGEEAFDKARYYFRMCKNICEDSADVVDAEIVIVDALSRKYAHGPNRFVGTWGSIKYDGSFLPYVDIEYDGKEYIFKLYTHTGEKIVESHMLGNKIEYVTETVKDKRDELRRNGYRYYEEEWDYNYTPDPGFESVTKYKYNVEICRYTNFIAILDGKVILKTTDMHIDSFYDGQKTFACTNLNSRRWGESELVKR